MEGMILEFTSGGVKCVLTRPNLISINSQEAPFKILLEPIGDDTGKELAVNLTEDDTKEIVRFLTVGPQPDFTALHPVRGRNPGSAKDNCKHRTAQGRRQTGQAH